ncbi:MAG: cytochrome C [Thermodesulfobacteria bacterium]|nr:cytochrome C [Thermodesulfobacteriota bacterium]
MKDLIKKAFALGGLIGLLSLPVGTAGIASAKTPKKPGIFTNSILKPGIVPQKTNAYNEKIKPLTTADCARCHKYEFNTLKEHGGKHRLKCTFCHTKFHVYNPTKHNWAEIMPKCTQCHPLVHGKQFADCEKCHTNPHAPIAEMKVSPWFAKQCAKCHPTEYEETIKYPSKHTKIGCTACHHTVHGYIPKCAECHKGKPHYSCVPTDKGCERCHNPHEPLNIPPFPKNTPNKVCAACHPVEYKKIETTKSKHHLVACVQCHPRHKYIPKCTECHPHPHSEALLKKYPNCLQCHIDVHNLPVAAPGK